MKRWIFAAAAAVAALMAEGTSVEWYESADGDYFRQKKVKTATSASAGLTLPAITGSEEGTPFAHWGTTFNELDWDAFLALDRADQDRLMHSLFAPDGDLRFTRGRIGMNCNDYGRSWFSCDEVPGDLELRISISSATSVGLFRSSAPHSISIRRLRFGHRLGRLRRG